MPNGSHSTPPDWINHHELANRVGRLEAKVDGLVEQMIALTKAVQDLLAIVRLK